MSQALPNVYVSYAWGGESEKVVDEVEAALKARGLSFVRDKAELGYKGRIREFMQEIGRGHAVVVVLSDKYLRSPNCMYELVEITKSGDVHERIFPVVLGDADIYDMARRLQYKLHWKTKLEELNQEAAKVGLANLHNAAEQATQYDRFGDRIMQLADLFGNMNTLTPSMHASSGYKHLVAALEEWMRKAPAVAAAQPVAGTAAAGPAPAAPAVKIPGLKTATESLLAPQAEDGAVVVIAAGETGEETVIALVAREGTDLVLRLGDDLAGLKLAPAAMARVTTAAAQRRLGRVGQVGAEAVQAALAAVVRDVFGLPDDEHSVRAMLMSAEDMQADGGPAADDTADDLGDDAGGGDDADPGVARTITGFDGAVAKLLGRLPRGEHMLIVGAGDDQDGFWVLLAVSRDGRGELTAMLMPAADLPPPLRPSRDALKAVRENFGLAPVPEAGPGVLNGRIGSVSDFDAAGLGAALERLLALAYRLPRDDFKFQADVQASD